ncbi:Alpha/beta hydrolase fold-3 [Dillenia turbinata]|uniref:Alpha/beta hydrolase fold-3 n=1 Tax=Dillenia turbinata TaxID=194707 RepID=A0AAN8YVG6_9MAGN
MASTVHEVAEEFLPFLRVYKDGTYERLIDPPLVSPSPRCPQTGVSSKDIVLFPETGVSARVYLPPLPQNHTEKLPILVYFHGGGFCVGSPFSVADHYFMNSLCSKAKILVISVDYRLAPTHPLPTAYDDAFSALKWVASHSSNDHHFEEWLVKYGDFNKIFLGGESAGGNIAHNVAMRAGLHGRPNGIEVLGVFLVHPYFWGSKPIMSEPKYGHEQRMDTRIWNYVYPGCAGGIDCAEVNPLADGAPSLAKIGCSRLLVCVAGNDGLRDRGVWYYEGVKKSGFAGEVELSEAEGENHVFHIFSPEKESSKNLLALLAAFINK